MPISTTRSLTFAVAGPMRVCARRSTRPQRGREPMMMGCRIGWKTITVVAALSALAIMAARAQGSRTGAPADGALFLAIAPVLQHPRCMNCHTQVDAPRQGDDQHRHIINVRRGADGHGAAALRCTTCHCRANNAPGGVPGAAEAWRPAPLSLGGEGPGAAAVCRHPVDPARNGR